MKRSHMGRVVMRAWIVAVVVQTGQRRPEFVNLMPGQPQTLSVTFNSQMGLLSLNHLKNSYCTTLLEAERMCVVKSSALALAPDKHRGSMFCWALIVWSL